MEKFDGACTASVVRFGSIVGSLETRVSFWDRLRRNRNENQASVDATDERARRPIGVTVTGDAPFDGPARSAENTGREVQTHTDRGKRGPAGAGTIDEKQRATATPRAARETRSDGVRGARVAVINAGRRPTRCAAVQVIGVSTRVGRPSFVDDRVRETCIYLHTYACIERIRRARFSFPFVQLFLKRVPRLRFERQPDWRGVLSAAGSPPRKRNIRNPALRNSLCMTCRTNGYARTVRPVTHTV